MNEITLTSINGIDVVDSRQVAEAVDKEHGKLLRDIRVYCGYLNEAKIDLVDFFIESSYTDAKGEQRPCYLCTRKGCEMIANKLTGEKGVVFTALYINAFHKMEDHIRREPAQLAEKRLELAEKEIRLKMSEQLLKLMQAANTADTYKSILLAKSAEILMGEPVIPLPKAEKTYSASDIGKMFGVSAQKIGHIANTHGLKSEEYGAWYRDKAKYSNKEVNTFRYNDKALEMFKSILKK